MILLYEADATDFSTNGLGALSDATKAVVKEERNGAFELELQYPAKGSHYKDITYERIIKCKSSPYSTPQLFRIYSVKEPIKGVCTINAQHISYDLNGYPVKAFDAALVSTAMAKLKSESLLSHRFTFTTDKTTAAVMKNTVPTSTRSLLGGQQGSVLDVYGGEYEFDNFVVHLWNNRGKDNNVTIEYGKNLTDFNQEKNCASLFTGVCPYWFNENDGLVTLPENIVSVQGTFPYQKIYSLDLTSEFREKPTAAQLRTKASEYINKNHVGVPKVSIDVSFVNNADLGPEFEALRKVQLCDTVHVKFPKFGVATTSKVISVEYNVLTDKYDRVSLGDAKSDFASTIAKIQEETQEKPTVEWLQQAIATASKIITGTKGGHLILWNNQTKKPENPNELVISQYAPNEAGRNYLTQGHVWRFNVGGWGHSANGYNGTYETAATLDGGFNAGFINTGILRSIKIQNGIKNGNKFPFEVDENGNLYAVNGTFSGTLTGQIDNAGSVEGGVLRGSEIIIGGSEQNPVFHVDPTGLCEAGNFIFQDQAVGFNTWRRIHVKPGSFEVKLANGSTEYFSEILYGDPWS